MSAKMNVVKDLAKDVHEQLENEAQESGKENTASAKTVTEIVSRAFARAGLKMQDGDYQPSQLLAAMEAAASN